MVESNGILVLADELLVQNIHHLKERRTLEDVFEFVGLKVPFGFWSGLTPNADLDVDVAVQYMVNVYWLDVTTSACFEPYIVTSKAQFVESAAKLRKIFDICK